MLNVETLQNADTRIRIIKESVAPPLTPRILPVKMENKPHWYCSTIGQLAIKHSMNRGFSSTDVLTMQKNTGLSKTGG